MGLVCFVSSFLPFLFCLFLSGCFVCALFALFRAEFVPFAISPVFSAFVLCSDPWLAAFVPCGQAKGVKPRLRTLSAVLLQAEAGAFWVLLKDLWPQKEGRKKEEERKKKEGRKEEERRKKDERRKKKPWQNHKLWACEGLFLFRHFF